MNVKVVLKADCHVGKKLRKKGETVELPEAIASDFGEVQKPADLTKLKKEELLQLAAEKGVEVTADNNKAEIVEKLQAAATN